MLRGVICTSSVALAAVRNRTGSINENNHPTNTAADKENKKITKENTARFLLIPIFEY